MRQLFLYKQQRILPGEMLNDTGLIFPKLFSKHKIIFPYICFRT